MISRKAMERERRERLLKVARKPRPKFYRTMVSLTYYPRFSTRDSYHTGDKICQYYVVVISKSKGRWTIRQLEEIEDNLSLIMSKGGYRSDKRWKASTYELPSGNDISSVGYEDNVEIDWDETKGLMLDKVYRHAIFYRKNNITEYGERDIRSLELRLNGLNDYPLRTRLNREKGIIEKVR